MHDAYEVEIARLGRVSPEVLQVQHKAGLTKEDMKASMTELRLLREKVSTTRWVGPGAEHSITMSVKCRVSCLSEPKNEDRHFAI